MFLLNAYPSHANQHKQAVMALLVNALAVPGPSVSEPHVAPSALLAGLYNEFRLVQVKATNYLMLLLTRQPKVGRTGIC